MPGPNVKTTSATYLPAFDTTSISYNVTVLSASATRLGTLITTAGGSGIPVHQDRVFDQTNAAASPKTRPYNHVFFQVPSAATNKVWMTCDNNTAPVAVDGGPGVELIPGVIYEFECAGENLLRANTVGDYRVNAGSAFQFISSANQAMSVFFLD